MGDVCSPTVISCNLLETSVPLRWSLGAGLKRHLLIGTRQKCDRRREAVAGSRRPSDVRMHVVDMLDRMPILSIPSRSDGAKLSA